MKNGYRGWPDRNFSLLAIIPILLFWLLGQSIFAQTADPESWEHIRDVRAKQYLKSVEKFAASQSPEDREEIISRAKKTVENGLQELDSQEFSDTSHSNLLQERDEHPSLNADITYFRSILDQIKATPSVEDDPALSRAMSFLQNRFATPTRKNHIIAMVLPPLWSVRYATCVVTNHSPFGESSIVDFAFHWAYCTGFSSSTTPSKTGKSLASFGISTKKFFLSPFAKGTTPAAHLSSAFLLIAQTIIRRE